jgi:hypothetical protein
VPVLGSLKKVLMLAWLIFVVAVPCWTQVPLDLGANGMSRVRIDVLNPFGAPIGGAKLKIVGRPIEFAPGDVQELLSGDYRLEIRVPWDRIEKDIKIVRGESDILIIIPFVQITDPPRYAMELRFVALPPGCSQGLVQRLSDQPVPPIVIRPSGASTVIGPVETGVYSVLFWSAKGVCGVGGFIADGSAASVQIVVSPIGSRSAALPGPDK